MHRSGSWWGAARRGLGGALSAASLACAPVALRADDVAAARVAARAGVDVFELHASPGAAADVGWRLQLGHARTFVGSGLVAQALRLQRVGEHVGLGLAWEQRTSPVHRDDAGVVVLQRRASIWQLGCGARLRRVLFDGYAPRLTSEFHLGAGFRARQQAIVVRARRDTSVRVDLGLRLSLHRDVRLEVQQIREPGFLTRTRGALTLGAAPLAFHVGYDVATRVAAAGVAAGGRRHRLIYAARTHPELGWSHTWMLEWARPSASR